MKDLSLLDKIIVGRVEPHIYAFTTNTIPNYIKIGDTYRPVSIRLAEWKKYYPELEKKYDVKAMVSDDIFFRDYSVHQFLEHNLQKERLTSLDINKNIYFSNEFFKDTSTSEIEDAIKDIKKDFQENSMKYQFYNAKDNLKIITKYASTGMWTLRPNQQEVVNNFKKAYEAGRKNLLLYAVMRFDKSFTAMCCALEMGANVVLIVSAKADIKEEWKKTVQSAENFQDYDFIDSEELLKNNKIIKTKLANGRKITLFLTLQDLQGTKIKEKHQELFNSQIDLLLIDETHFGARAESYGAVLRDVRDYREDENIDFDDANNILKVLKSKVRIHLSGTPYRILMGSEFEKEDIIGFYQFPDIVKDKSNWDKEHILDDQYKEWDNPYYGFPQMIRFAFNPNKSIREKLLELKKIGITYAFSELFKPLSITKDLEGKHQKFKYETEILDLLEVIDGSKNDDEVLGFLDFNKIKEGKMCRHIVVVLPFCASCDSFEKLIKDNKDKFKNLNEYEIINISGVDESNSYKNINDIKYAIKNWERNNKKTITLTVNRMLTGSTVEEWDTMIYLKDTSSPQEYDQAIFRLQNQYVKEYVSENGDIIKYNMKPQTLLVDFNPNRMFIMQETKSLIYNVNTENTGNDKLKDSLENELNISPIIVFDSNKLKQITAIDIMNYISNYSNSRSVLDETNDLPIDFKLLNIPEIREIIFKQSELGSKSGLELTNTNDTPDDFNELSLEFEKKQDNDSQNNISDNTIDNNELKKTIVNKFRTYYVRILFYSFLSDSKLNSLKNIIDTYDNNKRILDNLELDIDVLKLIYKNIDPFVLNQLDYKIQNINKLANDESLAKIDRALVAINKFNKISESEIITPQNMCNTIVNMLSIDDLVSEIKKGYKIMDIASKQGEFILAFYKKLKEHLDFDILKDLFYSIPTSSIAYEFTRKMYEILDLNVKNIAKKFNSYSMINILNNNQVDYDKISKYLIQKQYFEDIELEQTLLSKEGINNMKFSVVVGNPPYQEGRKSIFHHFQLISDKLKPSYSVLIYPGKRWIHKSGKGMEKFGQDLINDKNVAKLIYYPNSRDIFDCVDVSDGISIVYKDYNNSFEKIDYTYINGNKEEMSIMYDRPGKNLIPLCPSDKNLVDKIERFRKKENLSYISEFVSEQKFFGIESNFVELNSSKVKPLTDNYILKDKEIKILTNDKAGSQGRSKWFVVSEDLIKKNTDAIHKWKVVVSSAHPGGQDGRDNQLEVLDNYSVFGRARVALKFFETKEEADNFYQFFNSKIIRFSLLLTDENLSSFGMQTLDIIDYTNKNKYIDFSKSIDDQLQKLLKITNEEMKYISNKLS